MPAPVISGSGWPGFLCLHRLLKAQSGGARQGSQLACPVLGAGALLFGAQL